jgi:hypothetical protein
MGLLSFRKGPVVETSTADPDAIATGVDQGVTNETKREVPVDEIRRELSAFEKEHMWDPNMPQENLNAVKKALQADDVNAEMALENALIEENSPYAEVRAAVRSECFPRPTDYLRC